MKRAIASSMALLLLAAGAAPARASGTAGSQSFDFLLLDPSARAVGLGGAYTALATDANALYYNPAGLGFVKSHEATFMHNQYVQGLTQDYAAFSSRQGWGASANYLNYGGITRTRLDAPDGGLGNVGLTGLALGGGYGRALTENLSLGGGVQLLRETIDGVSATGLAAEAGVLGTVPAVSGLALGAALLNAGPPVRFESQREGLPILGRAGAAYSFGLSETDNTVALDLTKAGTDKVRLSVGGETVVQKALAFRLGFDGRNDAGPGVSVGVGFRLQSIGFDYAFVPFGDLGSVHRISLAYRWGGEDRRDTRRAERKPMELKEPPSPADEEELSRIRYTEQAARTSLKEGDIASAKGSFARAIRLAASNGVKDPVVADAYAGMGLCLAKEGQNEYAVKFLTKALDFNPGPQTRTAVEAELAALSKLPPSPRQ